MAERGTARPRYTVENGRPGAGADAPTEEVRAHDHSFLNPYGFVGPISRGSELDPAWRDAEPVSRGAAATDRWSGRIVVHATALTPLLFPDETSARAEMVNGELHRSYATRRTTDQGPELPITGFKGSLRAAYEAITASRFGVWSSEWDGKLPLHKKGPTWRPRGDAKRRNLLPPKDRSEFSAADRVFGQVTSLASQKGRVRIRSIRCADDDPSRRVVTFDRPIPLAVLGKPDPESSRFYRIERNRTVEVRGRKFYWHHADAAADPDGWSRSRTFQGRGRTNQNRSVSSWVAPRTRFRVEVDVSNLTPFELGALLWLLDKVEGASIRVGYGKPLGFGSLHLEVDRHGTTLLETADLIEARYRRIAVGPTRSGRAEEIVNHLTDRFEQSAPDRVLQQYRRLAQGVPGVRFQYPNGKLTGRIEIPDVDDVDPTFRSRRGRGGRQGRGRGRR